MKNLDVFEVRRVNLKTIIDQQFAGVQRGLAEAIARQPDYISRCLSGQKADWGSFCPIY